MATRHTGWIAGVVLLVVAVGGYWYYSPYLVMKTMNEAAQQHDADTFNQGVDYPKVRDSLKGQMASIVTEKVGDPAGDGIAAFGAMLGLTLANQLVDAYVRPEVVMRAMVQGDLKPALGQEQNEAPSPSANNPPEAPKRKIHWTFERKSLDKIIAYGHKPKEEPDAPATGFVFERAGFAHWKLTGLRLPLKP